jgi:hypothetical protein
MLERPVAIHRAILRAEIVQGVDRKNAEYDSCLTEWFVLMQNASALKARHPMD